MDNSKLSNFSNFEAEDKPTNNRLVEVSEKTKELHHNKCTQKMQNIERKTCIMGILSDKNTTNGHSHKGCDRQLAKVQTLMLN